MDWTSPILNFSVFPLKAKKFFTRSNKVFLLALNEEMAVKFSGTTKFYCYSMRQSHYLSSKKDITRNFNCSQVMALIGLSSEKDLTHRKSILEEREQEREIHTPDCFNTGRGSPVRLDSSTMLLPPVTTPSTGIRSCQI